METVVTLPANCSAPPAPPAGDVAPRIAAAGPAPLFAAAAAGGVTDGADAAGPAVGVAVDGLPGAPTGGAPEDLRHDDRRWPARGPASAETWQSGLARENPEPAWLVKSSG